MAQQLDMAGIITGYVREKASQHPMSPAERIRQRSVLEEFVGARELGELPSLGPADVEAFVAHLQSFGADRAAVDDGRSVAHSFVQFVGSGGIARVQEAAPDSEERPLFDPVVLAAMREDLLRLWGIEGMAFALAVAAPLIFVVLGLTLVGILFYIAGLAATYFLILAHVAKGRRKLPQAAGDRLLEHLGRGAALMVIAVLPALVVNLYLDVSGFEGVGLWLGTGLALLLGVALVPAGTIAMFTYHSGLLALAPHLWVRVISKIPRSYTRVALVYLALGALALLWTFGLFSVLGMGGAAPSWSLLMWAPPTNVLVLGMAVTLGGVIARNPQAVEE